MSVGSNQTDLQVETMYARDLELLSVEEKSVCSTDVNHTYNEAENEATKGPGMWLSGEKYRRRTKTEIRVIAAAATGIWKMLPVERDSGDIAMTPSSWYC